MPELIRPDDDFDTPINLLFLDRSGCRSDKAGFPIASSVDPASGDLHHRDQPGFNAFRSASAELEVVSVGTEGIGMTLDDEGGLGIPADQRAELLKAGECLGRRSVLS